MVLLFFCVVFSVLFFLWMEEARKQLRTKAHAQFERLLAELGDFVAPCSLTDKLPDATLDRLRSALHDGRFGPRASLVKLLQRFGERGMHPNLLQALRTDLPMTEQEQRMYEQWKQNGSPRVFLRTLRAARRGVTDVKRFCTVKGRLIPRRLQLLQILRPLSPPPPPLTSPPPPRTPPALCPFACQLLQEVCRYEGACMRSAFPERRLSLVRQRGRRFLANLTDFAAPQNLEQFFQTADTERWRSALITLADRVSVCNDRVKSSHRTHHAAPHVKQAMRILRILARHARCLDLTQLSVRTLLSMIPNLRVPADPAQRRVFSPEEMNAMKLVAAADPVDALLFALLQEVALRNSALGHLQLDMLLDPVSLTPRLLCQVPEKGRTARHFQSSPNVRAHAKTLSDFLHALHPAGLPRPCFLLNVRRPDRPLSYSALRKKVRALAARAGVTGVRVTPHSFRHTLVGVLVAAGNPLDVVSRYIGHADMRTTSYFYWLPTGGAPRIINPFSSSSPPPASLPPPSPASLPPPSPHTSSSRLRVVEKQLEAARKVIRAYEQCVTEPEDRARLIRRLPRLEPLVRCIFTPAPS